MASTIDPSTLGTFAGAAAGHEGVLSDASGELVIKPCTPAEVAFYEHVNSEHPDLAEHLPQYIGTLQLGNQLPAALPTETEGTTAVMVDAQPLNVHTSTHRPSSSIPPPSPPSPPSQQKSATSGTAATLAPSDPGLLRGKKLDTSLHIVLKNVTAGFSQPNILDLKLGSRLWAEDANPAKRARLDKVAAETTSGSLGFRIAGMRVWQGPPRDRGSTNTTQPIVDTLENVLRETGDDNDDDNDDDKDNEGDGEERQAEHWYLDTVTNHRNYNKLYGRQFTTSSILTGFKEYLLVASAGITASHARTVTTTFLADLKIIESVLQTKHSRMYSSSLLFVYEGDPDAFRKSLDVLVNGNVKPGQEEEEERRYDSDGDESADENEVPRLCAVRLIDFAHARIEEGIGPDENVLRGVRSAMEVLERLLEEFEGEG